MCLSNDSKAYSLLPHSLPPPRSPHLSGCSEDASHGAQVLVIVFVAAPEGFCPGESKVLYHFESALEGRKEGGVAAVAA